MCFQRNTKKIAVSHSWCLSHIHLNHVHAFLTSFLSLWMHAYAKPSSPYHSLLNQFLPRKWLDVSWFQPYHPVPVLSQLYRHKKQIIHFVSVFSIICRRRVSRHTRFRSMVSQRLRFEHPSLGPSLPASSQDLQWICWFPDRDSILLIHAVDASNVANQSAQSCSVRSCDSERIPNACWRHTCCRIFVHAFLSRIGTNKSVKWSEAFSKHKIL